MILKIDESINIDMLNIKFYGIYSCHISDSSVCFIAEYNTTKKIFILESINKDINFTANFISLIRTSLDLNIKKLDISNMVRIQKNYE